MLKTEDLLNVDKQLINETKNVQSSIHFVAIIDETKCIGCTKCFQVCPVDAIIGTIRTIHTVIADFCTGCNLCIPPCPTQCISLQKTKLISDA